MLSILLRLGIIGVITVAGVWGWLAWRAGEIALALAGVTLVSFGYALVLAGEFAMVWRSRAADSNPAQFAQLIAAWSSEVLRAPQAFCWRIPFRSRLLPDHIGVAAGAGRGVILVHGFMCNRGVWNPWMERLGALGIPFIAVNLEPVFGPIEQYADSIGQAVQRMTRATGMAPVIVAHSMGGLAVRSWLAGAALDSRVHRIITIGAPHRGTALARVGLSANARQMRPGSMWLEDLERAEPLERRQRYTCFFSHCDNVVFPSSRAALSGADNRHICGNAHLQLLESKAVFAEVLRWVGSPLSGIEADAIEGSPDARRPPAVP